MPRIDVYRKHTIVIYTYDSIEVGADIPGCEIEDLAREATSGSNAICTQQESERVHEKDLPDEAQDFFVNNLDDENEEEAAILEKLIEAESGDHRIELEYIGEGRSGDYNEGDPEDQPLLRFTLYTKGERAAEIAEFYDDITKDDPPWFPVRDGSYCTSLDARVDEETAQKYADALVEAFAFYDAQGKYKRFAERVTWEKTVETTPLRFPL